MKCMSKRGKILGVELKNVVAYAWKDRFECWRLADLALTIILADSVLAALTENGRS